MVMVLEWLKFHNAIVYFDSSTHFMVLECWKIHRSIVYFDSSTQLWSSNG